MYKRLFTLSFFVFAISTVVFPQRDSLFNNWNSRLDAIDFSNIDRLPIYRFTLNEIRDEAKQYATNKNLQSDNQYKDLSWKIDYLFNLLEQRILQIDSLFFAKASQFERQKQEQDAVFYYRRSLDFNPTYCLSIEKLSTIYAKNGQYEQYLELLHFLSLDNRLKNCDLRIFDLPFDSLIAQSNRLIEHRNYYDGLKILDTMRLFLQTVSQEKYVRTYNILLELAQNGIYNSYYDIISKSIKVNKLALAKEYISGLFLAITNYNQQPNQNFFFTSAMQNLIFAHRSNADMDIQRKRYEKAIETTDSMRAFLNSVNFLYADNLFFDIYSAAYTEQYFYLLQNNSIWADDFYQKYSSYIVYKPVKPENQEIAEKKSETIKTDTPVLTTYKSLYYNVNEYVFNSADFSDIDSFYVWKTFLKNISGASDYLQDYFAELKMKSLMLNALSKTNQYAWSNELLKAIYLLEKIDSVFVRFALQEDGFLAGKNAETTDLVEERIQKYAYEEVQLRFSKARNLIEQKQYDAAYSLLTKADPIIGRSVYKFDTEPLARQIILPATFQKEEQEAKNMLEMGYFLAGFAKYEQVHTYFENNEISQYGLECDDLQDFVEKSNREKYFRELTLYYIAKNLCKEALTQMFHTIKSGKGNKQWQTEVGEAMKKLDNCKKSVKNKVYTKEHKPFLDAYFGEKISWWYVMRTQLTKAMWKTLKFLKIKK